MQQPCEAIHVYKHNFKLFNCKLFLPSRIWCFNLFYTLMHITVWSLQESKLMLESETLIAACWMGYNICLLDGMDVYPSTMCKMVKQWTWTLGFIQCSRLVMPSLSLTFFIVLLTRFSNINVPDMLGKNYNAILDTKGIFS